VHPDRPELLTEILDWYDDVAGAGGVQDPVEK
jgi:hypothetical protein